MRSLVFVLALLAIPTVWAIEPQGGPPTPWILQGPVFVSSTSPGALPCADVSQATIYTWVQSWSANFQLSVVGGCDTLATVFYGTGNIWEGFDLSDFVVGMDTGGTLGAFFDKPTVPLDLTQTMPDGSVVRVTGDFVIIF